MHQKCAHIAYDLWDALVTVCVVLQRREERHAHIMALSFMIQEKCLFKQEHVSGAKHFYNACVDPILLESKLK